MADFTPRCSPPNSCYLPCARQGPDRAGQQCRWHCQFAGHAPMMPPNCPGGHADALRVELFFCRVGVSVINPSTMRTPMAQVFSRPPESLAADGGGRPLRQWQDLWPGEWLDRYIEVNTQQLDRIAEDPIAQSTIFCMPWRRFAPSFATSVVAWPRHCSIYCIVLSSGLSFQAPDYSRHRQGSPSEIAGLLHININCSDFERPCSTNCWDFGKLCRSPRMGG